MPNKHFTVGGVATWVHHTGPTTLPGVVPDLSRGELVLCLHGAGGNGGSFSTVLDQLAATHSPLAFDQPGHGRSGGLDSLGSIERMTEFLRTLVETLALRPPVLLGHSMGGAVALAYALRWPESVRGLVLCGTAARFPIPEERMLEVRRVVEGKARRTFNREAYSPSASPEVLRRGFMEELKTDPRARYGDILACLNWDVEERLGAVRAPTLLVWGEDEMPALRKQEERLAAALSHAQRAVIPKAGHVVQLEQPEALVRHTVRFLEELGR